MVEKEFRVIRSFGIEIHYTYSVPPSQKISKVKEFDLKFKI